MGRVAERLFGAALDQHAEPIQRAILRENQTRGLWIGPILTLFAVGLLARCHVLGIDGYGFSYVFIIAASCVCLPVIALTRRASSGRGRLGRFALVGYALSLLLWTVSLSFASQGQSGGITEYVIGACVLAVAVYLRPMTSALIFLTALVVLVGGISHFQPVEELVFRFRVNTAILTVVAWTISLTLYKARVDGLVKERTLQSKSDRLEKALERVHLLSGLLPICASCKKIRDDQGCWNQMEVYIRDHSEADFSHGICPDCKQKLYGDLGRNARRD